MSTRTLLQVRLQGLVVTDADPVGPACITISYALMELTGLCEGEQVHVMAESGRGWWSWVAPAEDGEVVVGGPAARLVLPGDEIHLESFATFSPEELEHYQGKVLEVDEANQPILGAPTIPGAASG